MNEINNAGFAASKTKKLLYKFTIKVLIKVISNKVKFPSRGEVLRAIDQTLDIFSNISSNEYLSFLSSSCSSRDVVGWRGVAIYLIAIFLETKFLSRIIADHFKISEPCVWKRVGNIRQNRTYYNSHFRLNELIRTICSWKNVNIESISELVSQKSKLPIYALYNLNLFIFIQRLESQIVFCIFSLIWKDPKLRFQYFSKLNEAFNLNEYCMRRLNYRICFPELRAELNRILYTTPVCDLRNRFGNDPEGFIFAFNTPVDVLRKIFIHKKQPCHIP